MRIVFVVPTFRHSLLLHEAVQSVLDNGREDAVDIVIVDDGCPELETLCGGVGLSILHENVHYCRSFNKGLSGARNVGIEYSLKNIDFDAIYFLDADNRVSDYSVAQMIQLLRHNSEGDWFYPDIRMFGIEWSGSYESSFSPFIEALQNICEAGSLVRRRVFDRGIRFSETLKHGFEDWDFFLTASEAGFHGIHAPSLGFLYRKRPESMLADSTRDQEFVLKQLEDRHPWIKDRRWLTHAEHVYNPRYAIFIYDLGVVRMSSSIESFTEEMTWDEYKRRFWAWEIKPNVYNIGSTMIVMNSATLSLLESLMLGSWVIFDLERGLQRANLTSVEISQSANHDLKIKAPVPYSGVNLDCLAISSRLLREVVSDSSDGWVRGLVSGAHGGAHTSRAVHLPKGSPINLLPSPVAENFLYMCRDLATSSYSQSNKTLRPRDSVGSPNRASAAVMLRDKFGHTVLAPYLKRKDIEIGFVLPIVDFGGVEKVTLAVAKQMRNLGYGTNLFVAKRREIKQFNLVAAAFDRVFFIDNDAFDDWSGPDYLGTNLSKWSVSGSQMDEANLLSAMDVLISCHSLDILGVMGQLRRSGTVTASYLHLFDKTYLDRRVGHPFVAVAYEHALDLFIGCSEAICAELQAEGVPPSKLVVVPNAPSIRKPKVSRRERGRAGSSQGQLRVLYMGRLDRQKGIERLEAVVRELSQSDDIAFRIVGKTIIDDGTSRPFIEKLVEPPVYSEKDVARLYEWADVIILPSYYEGLPLTVLEAMLMGVIPLVTDVGAVREAVDHDVDGFVVAEENCVADMVAILQRLASDPGRVAELSQAAAAAGQQRSWARSVVDLDEVLRASVAKKRKRLSNTPKLAS
ncbi:glycosyltransferase [Methylobacterium sp. DB0501]|uniref:glycosyltransferase n=1 Tax=Methylobacterium sp. DB0501 TaxID=2709665 RepID=UPI0013ECAD14|nr:glycosyltransferase [Methylobacterium sp. DB0501]NGM35612.1 glycosyltransferase [Methylobacterium sp. DB0501]